MRAAAISLLSMEQKMEGFSYLWSTSHWRRCLTAILPSVITAKAANDYHFKTGQCEVAGTFMFYRVIPCRGKFNL